MNVKKKPVLFKLTLAPRDKNNISRAKRTDYVSGLRKTV